MFKETTLTIDNQVLVSRSGNVAFDNLELNHSLTTGEADLSMNGIYDPQQKSISGTFTVHHSAVMKNEREKPLTSINSNWIMTFDGSFSGKQL